MIHEEMLHLMNLFHSPEDEEKRERESAERLLSYLTSLYIPPDLPKM